MAVNFRQRKMSKTDWSQNDWLRRMKIILDRFFSNRKTVVGVLFALAVLLYFGPSWFFRRKSDLRDDYFGCLDEHLANYYSKDVENFDTFVRRTPNKDKLYVPFVGNGYFGLSLTEILNPLRVRHAKTLNLLSGFEPLVKIQPKFSYSFTTEALVLELRKGSATKLTAFNMVGECALLSSTVYAHRSRPSLLVQEVTVRNPTMSSLTISFERSTPSASKVKSLKSDGKLSAKSTKLVVPDAQDKFYVLGIGQHSIDSELIIKPQSTETVKFLTVITVSDALNATAADAKEKELEKLLPKLYNEAAKVETHLKVEHESTWNKLWSHGFSLSYSKAPDVINGDLINATIYYLLSNTPAPLQEISADDAIVQAKRKLLSNSDGCFNFHNTLMYPSKLWSHLSTVENVLDVSYRWKLTLNKRGCSSLVNAGADGLMQAIILSLGGLKFTNHHLEFDVEPKELHRHYFFRNVLYGDLASVNIWVEVGSDNKPVMFVSVNSTKRDEKKFYACDAGCLDDPAPLSNDKTIFPVKLTNPLTPILYITDDQRHLQELKHTIHVQEVVEAPAHEHHVIAMHKHGHRLGGLPTLFWVALIILLIIFHLFLFKLIYNEYCRDEKPTYPPSNRMRYAV